MNLREQYDEYVQSAHGEGLTALSYELWLEDLVLKYRVVLDQYSDLMPRITKIFNKAISGYDVILEHHLITLSDVSIYDYNRNGIIAFSSSNPYDVEEIRRIAEGHNTLKLVLFKREEP